MTMIEKMARAISKQFFGNESHWTDFIEEAKAALECLKELTEGMANAGTNAYHDELWVDKIFQEMIDAALEGK